MPEEIKCPKCGENMEEIQRKIAAGAGGGPKGNIYPPEEIHIKYKCSNRKCSYYGKEFYENDFRKEEGIKLDGSVKLDGKTRFDGKKINNSN